jgi:hypothetical protein
MSRDRKHKDRSQPAAQEGKSKPRTFLPPREPPEEVPVRKTDLSQEAHQEVENDEKDENDESEEYEDEEDDDLDPAHLPTVLQHGGDADVALMARKNLAEEDEDLLGLLQTLTQELSRLRSHKAWRSLPADKEVESQRQVYYRILAEDRPGEDCCPARLLRYILALREEFNPDGNLVASAAPTVD